MPQAPHPAIARGHFQFQTFMLGQAGRTDANGNTTLRTVGTVPMLLRVVVAGDDMRAYLPDVLADDTVELTDRDLVQMVAGYLREGLVDPWDGQGSGRVMPVVVLATKAGRSFVQAVGCLN